TDRVADTKPRREKRNGNHVARHDESTAIAVGRHLPERLHRGHWDADDDRPGPNNDEADGEEGNRCDRHTADHAAHRCIGGSLNGNQGADDHGERTPQDDVQCRHFRAGRRPSLAAMVTSSGRESAFILRIIWPRCALTVISLMPSSPPPCLFNSPATTNAITSRSRG